MLPFILFVSSFVPANQASLECTNTGVIQTQPVSGPDGIAAVLKVSTEDDHGKNSHLCTATYQLLLISGAGGALHVVDVLSSDDDYNRSLSLRLSGFSQDGKRVLGILSEGGKHPLTTLFDYHTSDGKVDLIDITEQFAPIMAANCSSTLEVAGTTETGAIVLEPNSANQCGSSRWLVDFSGGRTQRLAQGAPILELYNLKDRQGD
jgi:hypothetical protein